MSLREHVKQRILLSSFDVSVIDVYSHMFAVIGNGYYWTKDGEYLCNLSGLGRDSTPIEYWQSLADKHPKSMKFAAQVLKRQFIHDNIDAILDDHDLNDPFDSATSETLLGSYMDEHVSYNYAAVFNFPENINKEYADAMYRFIDYWQQALRNKYMVGDKKEYADAIAHWPEKAKEVNAKLNEAKERLIDTGHFGTRKQRAENAERILKLLEGILGKKD